KKSSFGMHGVSMDPKKVQSLLSWPTPTTAKGVRGKENRAADALSRIHEGNELSSMVSFPQWFDGIKIHLFAYNGIFENLIHLVYSQQMLSPAAVRGSSSAQRSSPVSFQKRPGILQAAT
nr:hypothetical protein [Tanacetum cinerariifolium]